jgi:hypothetical protein
MPGGAESTVTAPAESIVEQNTWLPVVEPVEAGEVLALDPAHPGLLHRAASMADRYVIGVAAGPSRAAANGGLEAPMVDASYATVKADAGYGAIRPGDPLVTSPTPGHAMRALELGPGTVIGEAIDSLEHGTGSIRVFLRTR